MRIPVIVPAMRGNADTDQALFDTIAEAYNRKDLLPASSLARRRRLQATIDVMEECRQRKASLRLGSVLEIGCGAAWSADYLRGHYSSYTGIDHSSRLIALARARLAHNPHLTLIPGNLHEAQLPSESFDSVIGIGILHHMERPTEALSRLRSCLRPDGLIAVNEPQTGSPVCRVLRHARKNVDRSYSKEQVQYETCDLIQQFVEAGYQVEGIGYQGIFSTLFAEVAVPFQAVARVFSAIAVGIDTVLECLPPAIARLITWNVIVVASTTASRESDGGSSGAG